MCQARHTPPAGPPSHAAASSSVSSASAAPAVSVGTRVTMTAALARSAPTAGSSGAETEMGSRIALAKETATEPSRPDAERRPTPVVRTRVGMSSALKVSSAFHAPGSTDVRGGTKQNKTRWLKHER